MKLLLITIDCLRADHLSCIGYRKNTSPFIDHLAKKGALYTNVIANGLGTAAAFPALMTSTYPHMSTPYKWSRKTVAEVLKERGYKTAGFNDNPFLSSYFGYDRGFDYFEYFVGLKEKMKKIGSATRKLHNFTYLFPRMFSFLNLQFYKDGQTMNRKVFSWLEENYTHSFFVWVHFMDLHGPYRISKDYIQKVNGWCPSIIEREKLSAFIGYERPDKREIDVLKAVYDAGIRYVDDRIRELFKKLISLGIAKVTNLMIAADHGEEFFEHGGYHRHSNFYDEMLRTPLVIYGPNVPNMRIDRQVEHIDLAPTILDIVGETKENTFIGKSLLANPRSRYIITETGRGISLLNDFFDLQKMSIREEDGKKWKYIVSIKEMKEELYNLSTDPFEKNDQTKKAGKVLKRLRNKAMKHIKKAMIWEKELQRVMKKSGQIYSVEEEEQIKKRLRSLGYL